MSNWSILAIKEKENELPAPAPNSKSKDCASKVAIFAFVLASIIS